jgi:hypothetical protein
MMKTLGPGKKNLSSTRRVQIVMLACPPRERRDRSKPLNASDKGKGGRPKKASCRKRGMRWIKPGSDLPQIPRFFELANLQLQIADAVKRYSYLLGQTELFKHFVDIKVRKMLFYSLPLSTHPPLPSALETRTMQP